MAERSPAGPLMHEHRIIERMLAILRRELESMGKQEHVDPTLIDTAVDFIRTYADRCHHGKEEDILFRRLAAKDLDTQLAEAMADLIEDHVHGRTLTRQLVEANRRYAGGETTALSEIESAVQALVEFYPVHIEKEDRHFFKPCLEYFTKAEQAEMLRDFDEFDRALIHEKYRGLVEDLERASR
jgi:hemerythrin-like domain-containing protein